MFNQSAVSDKKYMAGYNFITGSLTKAKHRKNRLAIHILRLLGFTVYPCWLGGTDEEGGRIVYFTASSLPIEYEDDIAIKD